jgi:hypothetical protein
MPDDIRPDGPPAIKRDLRELERDLKQFILELEISSMRRMITRFLGSQIAYFAVTLAGVWFMLSHLH